MSLASAPALAFDAEDVGVVDDAVDAGDGGAGVGEDGGPVAAGEIGGEDETFLFVATADDLEEEVGVAVVVGEVADFIDDEQRRARTVVAEPPVETAGGVLGGEIEEELTRRREEDGVAGEDGLVRDVLGNHGLAEALRGDEHDVAGGGEEVELEGLLG